MEQVRWYEDLLPEHLWMAALNDHYSLDEAVYLYNQMLDALDPYNSTKEVLLGMVSDFGVVAEQDRSIFIENHRRLVERAVWKPFGRIAAFYPDSPISWLLTRDFLENAGSLDPQVELGNLERICTKLFEPKDSWTGMVRSWPLNRMFKHDKMVLHPGLSVIPLLSKYPTGCTDDEIAEVQAFARNALNMFFQMWDRYKGQVWPKYFWRHNFDLVSCRDEERPARLSNPDGVNDRLDSFFERAFLNADRAESYLKFFPKRIRFDLYNPTKDEVICGIFCRISRLYAYVMRSFPGLSHDLISILLRCFCDSLITLAYLLKKGTASEFDKFVEYGLGKEKLIMLHLQDNHPDSPTLDGKTPDDIAQGMGGGMMPEFLDIELDNWTKKSVRDLAIDVGLERLYRLVYDPASSDVHGSWTNLRGSYLRRCQQVLHRFHRLPSSEAPPLYLESVVTAEDLYAHALDLVLQEMKYPNPEEEIEPLRPILESLRKIEKKGT